MALQRERPVPLRNQMGQGEDPGPIVTAVRVFLERVAEMQSEGISNQQILEDTEEATGIKAFSGRNGGYLYQREALQNKLAEMDLGRYPRRERKSA